MAQKFDPHTQSLLEPVTPGSGELKHRSFRTGALYDTTSEDTLLASGGDSQVDVMSKFKNTIRVTAYEPINPYIHAPCANCSRQLVRYQRLGDSKLSVHVCICGNTWT